MTILAKNKTRITLGTVLKIWHGTRGHDYVVCGIDTANRQVHLLKHNSINQDGSIHAATSRAFYSHKVLNYNAQGILNKVNTVVGQCKRLDLSVLDAHFKSASITTAGFTTTAIYSTAQIDRRDSFSY
jgi:hypothetical protein